MPSQQFDLLLLDLGGVLLEVDSLPSMRRWTRLPDAEIWRRWLESPSVRLFETGGCEPSEFADSVVAELGLEVEPDEFLHQFERWCLNPHPGAEHLLAELRPRYRLACLSNTNATHWEHIRREWTLLDSFHDLLPSHQTGRIKPDAEAFHHAVERLDCPIERILFFDDNLINVEGARAAGLQSHQVKDTQALRATLEELGLL